jgi:hypothetical protein
MILLVFIFCRAADGPKPLTHKLVPLQRDWQSQIVRFQNYRSGTIGKLSRNVNGAFTSYKPFPLRKVWFPRF